jgi:LPS export ABC transporter protein LptC/lipopolysaccharide transport protein LptA
MASVTNGVERSTGSGIVLAGDRSLNRRDAARHTTVVRLLKLAFPVTALAVVGSYAITIVDTTGWGMALKALDVPQIVAENLAMENPHYEGFNKDGGRYWVTAQKAMQDIKDMSVIKLDTITGELIDASKERTRLTATRGTFNNKRNVIELFDAIDIAGENGLKAKLTRATIMTKEGIISSDEPVRVAMPAGVITANQMTVRQKEKSYAFVQNVRTELKGRAANPAAAGAQPAQSGFGFGNAGDPITIRSTRLDVNDVTKVALFSGSVKAVQGEATLTSPEMEVTYEGNAVTGADKTKTPKDAAKPADTSPPQAADEGGKVKKVIAKNAVTLTQAGGQKATSRSAEFDAEKQTALLEGDVVMSEEPDRKAVGDRAEIDQVAGTVLLTGPVIVTQGTNELRGRKLSFNRTNGKMNLTAAGAGNGRISARFTQNDVPGAPAKKAEAPKGMAFSGSFKTDPSAPVDVTAERLDVDDNAKQAIFTGDVKAQQAGFNLTSSELIASYTGAAGFGGGKPAAANAKDANAGAKLTRIQAKKNVEVTSKDGQKATGDWADYDTKANTVTLGGDVVMMQGKNVVRGTKLVIDMTTGESVISTQTGGAGQAMTSSTQGNGDGLIVKSGRPSAVFYPNQLKEKAGKAAEKAAEGWQVRKGPSQ